jgi:hypothetical protein
VLWPQLRGGRGDSAGREIVAASNSVKTMKQDHEAWPATGGKASPCRARTTAAFSVTCGRVKVRLDSPDRVSSTAAGDPRDQLAGPVPAGVVDPVGGDGGEHGEQHGRGQ